MPSPIKQLSTTANSKTLPKNISNQPPSRTKTPKTQPKKTGGSGSPPYTNQYIRYS